MNKRIGANDLQSIVNDYAFMGDEIEALKDELRAAQGAIHDLDRDNRHLSDQLEKITAERDKLQAFSVNLVTRLQVISENVENVIKESGRAAIAEAGRLRDRREGRVPLEHPVRRAAQGVREQIERGPEAWAPPPRAPVAPPQTRSEAILETAMPSRTAPPINEFR